MLTRTSRREFLSATGAAALAACAGTPREDPPAKRPNILLAYADDISYPHMGAYGAKGLSTPAFDRVAAEGALFHHSYTGAPSCTPSRSCALSGQQLYRLREAGCLFGTFPADIDVYPLLLEAAGYHVGHTAKGWAPGVLEPGGRTASPCGEPYNKRRYQPGEVLDGMNLNNYAENFRDFLAARPAGAPFCFWYGATEAHRKYQPGSGLAAGKKLEDVVVPEFLPDTDETRSDILDSYMEIEWFDQHLAKMLAMIEEAGELDDTIVVVTADNGMPFPRAKATLYDWGVRMPLAIRWGAKVPAGKTVHSLVHHTDFAPTFLEAAGLPVPEAMTGRSLLPLLEDPDARDPGWSDFTVTAIERHAWCRPEGALYPSRMIRTPDYLYIRNYEPERWPSGDPDFQSSHQGVYGEIDNGASKTFLLANREKFPREFELCCGKRPAEELYQTVQDPWQTRNLADDPAHAERKKELADRLDAYLAQTGDPRSRGESPWDDYPYYFGDLDPRKA
ncbi:MAG: sulfatase-like hydrolase/transferase [Acidobacteria bacterium]|nr:sulfatase-like hydrolase/transferase [Acidobacteriota bacterium]